MVKFTNRAKPRPVTLKKVQEQHQIDLVDMRNIQVEYNGKLFRYILSLLDVFYPFTGWFLLRQKESKVWQKNLLESTPVMEYRNVYRVKTTVSSQKTSKSFLSRAKSKYWGVVLITPDLKWKLRGYTACSSKRVTMTSWHTKNWCKLSKKLTALYEMLQSRKKRRAWLEKCFWNLLWEKTKWTVKWLKKSR